MTGRSLVLRLFAALLAATQAFAPGVVSLLDARPAAMSQWVQLEPHVDAPGTAHPVAHPDRCALCGVATRVATTAPPPVALPVMDTDRWPVRESRVTVHDGDGQWSHPSRAPPFA